MLFFNKAIFKMKTDINTDGVVSCPNIFFRPFFHIFGYKHVRLLKLLLFCSFSLLLLTYYLSTSFANQPYTAGIVTVNELQMRATPQMNAPILKMITKGKKIEIYDQQGAWIKIVHEGQTGYIQKQKKKVFVFLETAEEPLTEKQNKLKVAKFKQEAEEINRKIEKRKADIQSITQKERSIINNLNETDLSLNKSKKLVSLIKTDLAILSKKITATRNATKSLEIKIQSNEQYAARRLVALYKLNWLGKMHMIASAESMDELLQRKIYLEHILDYDRKTINQLIENKNQHTNLLKKLKSQQREKLSLEKDYKGQISISSNRKNERKKLLADIRDKKSVQIASIKSLQKASIELDQTIKSLSREIKHSGTTANISAKSFSSFKGLLKMPAKGKIVTKFGPYKNKELNVMNYRNGIDIVADKGEPIKAVRAGNVIFANWFKGYGNMIILDHGNRYYTVYAHAEELFKQRGQKVKSEEVIAIVGDTGSLIGHELYFEIRHQDKPVDPLKWLNVEK
jgi:septal ring factor EnvC (AmiA/AmiB activator)